MSHCWTCVYNQGPATINCGFIVSKKFFKKIEKNLKKGLTKWNVCDIIIWHSERAPKKSA